ncbi:MAG: FitA-like ribbon-helix-helix domain-containing protein [Candidatus Acidiferrales bacterium]
MATLYVENVPDELYEALRTAARSRRRSIAAEVTALLEAHFPTQKTLKARRALLRKIERMQSARPLSRGPFPSAEEMQREDRER